MSEVKTLIIDNFRGSMTTYLNGDINSGLTNVITQSGPNSFIRPKQLTWNENAEQIDSNGSVITDLIVAGKARVESGIVYAYLIGHLGRLYKVQVNDPTTYNPNYDNPVLLATLSTNSPTFTRGGFLTFYGATEQIVIGHDKGLTRINFDGTSETFVGVLGSWTQTCPRPLQTLTGNLYVGNGSNLTEVTSSFVVSTYSKLSPALPSNVEIRDLDVTPDGNYLQIVGAGSPLTDITSTTPPTALLGPVDSYVFKWNGTDTGVTSYVTYNSSILTANTNFGNSNYVFGYDVFGGALYNPMDKWLTSTVLSTYNESPSPNAVTVIGGQLNWMTPLTYDGAAGMMVTSYGTISGYEIENGFFCPFFSVATGTETDVNRIPCMISVSNFGIGTSTNGYTDLIFGTPKVYFSTLETSSGTTKYKLYKWSPTPTGAGTAIADGFYETQKQLFSKKITIKEVRVYGQPWVANNEFTVHLIGSSEEPINNGSKTFTAGTNLTIGDDFAWWTPQINPTYALGLRIVNTGTANHVINKVEIDYSTGGK